MNKAKILEFPAPKKPEVYKASKSRYATIEKHMKRVLKKRGVFPKADIHALTKCLNSGKWEKDPVAADRIDDLRRAVVGMIERPIEKHQSDFGIKWLKDNFIKKRDGGAKALLRKAAEDDDISTIIDIVNNFKCFKFVGVHTEYSNWDGRPMYHYPIYRTYSKDGSYFDYTPIQWNTPIIHETRKAY